MTMKSKETGGELHEAMILTRRFGGKRLPSALLRLTKGALTIGAGKKAADSLKKGGV